MDVLSEIAACLRNGDDEKVAQLTQQAFQERLYNYYDMLRLSDEPMDQVDLRANVEGLEVIDRLVEAKRGASGPDWPGRRRPPRCRTRARRRPLPPFGPP